MDVGFVPGLPIPDLREVLEVAIEAVGDGMREISPDTQVGSAAQLGVAKMIRSGSTPWASAFVTASSIAPKE